MHIDTGPDREWGTRWPKSDKSLPRFSPPKKPGPQSLAGDKSARGAVISAGGGVAAVTSMGGLIGDLGPVAQVAAIVGLVAIAGGLLWIWRDRVASWR